MTGGETVRIVVLGAGKAGQAQLEWFRRDQTVEVVGVYDPDVGRALEAASGTAHVLRSLRELVALEPDLVSLCGPSAGRADQARWVIGHTPASVLCEKPVANTLDECDSVIAAARAANRTVYAMFNLRRHPVVEAVDGVLATVGDIHHATLDYTQCRQTVSWRHRAEQRGGVLKEQGIHALDLALRWLGPVARVAGEVTVVDPAREVEDHAVALMRHQTGATSIVNASYCDPQEEALHVALVGYGARIDAVLNPYDLKLNLVEIRRRGEPPEAVAIRTPTVIDPVYPGLADATAQTLGAVVRSVHEGSELDMDIVSARRSMELVAACYSSCETGCAVSLPVDSSSGPPLDLFARNRLWPPAGPANPTTS